MARRQTSGVACRLRNGRVELLMVPTLGNHRKQLCQLCETTSHGSLRRVDDFQLAWYSMIVNVFLFSHHVGCLQFPQLRTEVLKQDGSFDQYLTKRLENKDPCCWCHLPISSGHGCLPVSHPGRCTGLLQVYRVELPCWAWCVAPSAKHGIGTAKHEMCTTWIDLYSRAVSIFHLTRQYALESAFLKSPGAHLIRPWMLPHRADFGLRGTADVVFWLP